MRLKVFETDKETGRLSFLYSLPLNRFYCGDREPSPVSPSQLDNHLAVEYGFEPLAVRALAVALYTLSQHLVIYPSHMVPDFLR